jgi:hypothetical protein
MVQSGKISVTSAIGLLLCVKQSWFTNQESLDWLSAPLSEAAALGTVSHQMVEEIDGGKFDNLAQDQLERRIFVRWDDLVSEQRTKLEEKAKFGKPPKPSRWPFYIIKRHAMYERALNRQGYLDNVGVGVGVNHRPEIEESFSSDNLGLYGRIDRIEHTLNGVRIVDLKTSVNENDSISERFRIQLLLYCALYRDKMHVTPGQAAIEWQDGTRSYMNIFDNEIDDLLVTVKNSLELLSRESSPVGSPREDVCLYCNYRSVCSDFKSLERVDWSQSPAFVSGSVAEVFEHSDGKSIKVSLTEAHPPWIGSALVHRIPLGIPFDNGSKVVFDNLKWRGGEGNFDVTWKTRYNIE